MIISVSHRHNSAGTRKLAHQVSKGRAGSRARGGISSLKPLAALAGAFVFAFCQAAPLHAQQRKSKVPIVGKLTSGNQQQAYSGKIQSLDMKQKILNVNSIQGRDSEIFPVRKNMRVESLTGTRLDLTALTPGAAVLIYFDQKSGERTIKNIVVLSSGKEQEKDKPAPAS